MAAGLEGLRRVVVAPTFTPLGRTPGSSNAVRRMIGVSWSLGSARNWRQTANPLSDGMRTSRRITSGCSAWAQAIPAAASVAVSTR